MELGDGLRKRLAELEQRFPDMTRRIADIAEGATVRAIETATELTPPNTFAEGEIRGVHMLTGQMAQQFATGSGGGGEQSKMLESWKSDSQATPTAAAGGYMTVLANDKEHASYVNDGHRVDKHFVPGLYIDTDGLLSRDLNREGGLMVGVKTAYVEGLHITEKAIDAYDEVVRGEFEKLTREVGQ